MTAHTVTGDDFTALTVTDDRGATLNVERTDDGRMSAWIAPPGGNDGCSVRLDFPDAVSVAAYLSAGVRSWSLPAEPNVDRLYDRNGQVYVRTVSDGLHLWWEGEPGADRPMSWPVLLGHAGELHTTNPVEVNA